jgi:hypothetical protein
MNWECEKCKIMLPKKNLNEIFGCGIYICTPCIEKFLQPERLSEKTCYDNKEEMRLEEIHFPVE